ncbi:MAG: phosphoribosylanthranilate isomerase [Bacteroidota bacterium]
MVNQDLFVKICGVTNVEDAQFALECGADAIGLNFYERSPRFVTMERAQEIVSKLSEHKSKIGVFVNASRKRILEVIKTVNLSAVQLVGQHGPDDLVNFESSVIKVFRVYPGFDVEVLRNYIIDAFLLDTYQDETYGGTGKTFDWNVAIKAKEYGKVILSGGLNPENIEDAVKYVQPYGVDVSSGVELRPGRKDPKKIRDFIARARSVPLYYNEDLNNDEE